MADAPVTTEVPTEEASDQGANPETGLKTGFVHLHLHSMYSLLDGGNRVDKLIDRCVELGMDAVAVTDHGNMFGAMDLYRKANAKGVKPILGIEAYVAPDVDGRKSDRTVREYTGVSDGGFHLVLLAENNAGWQNLLKLSSDAYINGFYFKPRMDKGTLQQWADGLIAINGHLGSSIAYHLRKFVETKDKKHYRRAVEEAKWHAEVFKPNENGEPRFFIELQRHETQDQDEINPHLVSIAHELGLPLVCDNDAHFMTADDWDAHDTLCCISMGKIKEDTNRLHYPKELYVKSPAQMAAIFDDYPEAVANTVRIAERCNVELDLDANHAPVVKIDYRGKLVGEAAKTGKLPTTSEAALPCVEAFQCKHPAGSTAWFKAFCEQFAVIPFDSEKDTESEEELKEQCDGALRMLCEAGAIWRYGPGGVDDAKRARLERELQVLRDKLISAYFIIVWDFVNYARGEDIPCNARGSGVGTMTGYVLGLSNACPVEYGLLFERFTDPDRSEYPDIDIDMCQDGRQGLIQWVRDKYGHVAQIITFGTLKARAAIRDVGRVLNIPLNEVDELCKLVGDGLGTTLEKALAQEPDLARLKAEKPSINQLLETAMRLEGMARHAGVHAAGVIVATQPLDNIVPLYKPPGQEGQIVTQWDGPTCESVGLLKMDFLGLRTLSIIERAKLLTRNGLSTQTIKATVANGATPTAATQEKPRDDHEGYDIDDPMWEPLDLERLHYSDQHVLDTFRRGETKSVFQFESDGMRNTLMQMQPDRLEDLIAANALYRPGPMDLIDDYCDRKKGSQSVPTVHEIVDRLMSETYGIMVYQEQVMQVVNQLGGIPLRQAYSLIKAISKKKEKVINANRAQFIEGAAEKGLKKEQAAELFDLILKFAGYGFNKSHSTGYAIVAYQTAYLKTYFPLQYMAAVLTYESVSTEKVVEYMDECKRVRKPNGERGVEVRPPDINLSQVAFDVVFDKGEPRDANHGHIRFGLSAVKGVGEAAIKGIIAAREKDGPFKSLLNFCERVPLDKVNKTTIEALIKCGAFDAVHGRDKRAALCDVLEKAVRLGQQKQKDDASGQGSLFGGGPAKVEIEKVEEDLPLPAVTPWSSGETLRFEKEVLGFHLSDHPLNEYLPLIKRYTNTVIADIADQPANREVCLIGSISRVRRTVTRAKQEPMAMITMEDQTGSIDGVIFPRTFAIAKPLIEEDAILYFIGKVDRKRQEPNVLIDDVFPVEQAPQRMTRRINIKLREKRSGNPAPLNGELAQLQLMLRQQRAASGYRNGNGSGGGGGGGGNGYRGRGGGSPREEGATVEFEVQQAGKVVRIEARGLRVAVTPDLPARIATVLQDEDCCELLGPRKLKAASRVEINESSEEKLRTATPTGHDDVCASIDRYST